MTHHQLARRNRIIRYTAAMAVAALTAACAADTGTGVAPPAMAPPGASRHTISTLGQITLRGFTTDRSFSMYRSVPTYLLTGDYEYYWNWGQGRDSVHVTTFGADSYPEYMNGGTIYVSAIVNGVEQSLGEVSGDLSDKRQVFELPAGASVKLLGHPGPGCTFFAWKTSSGTGSGTFVPGNPNPLYIDASDVNTFREGWFQC